VTDRVKAFTVYLDEDMREEDAENVRLALLMVKRVSAVRPHLAEFSDDQAQERAERVLRDKLRDVLWPKR